MTTLFSVLSKRIPRPIASAVLAIAYFVCLFLTFVNLGYDGEETIVYFDYGVARDE